MAELPTLTKDEWNAMMAAVLTDVSIDPTDKWGTILAPGNQDGTHLDDIPDNHPADGGPKTPDKETDDEIPADGGFTTKVGKPEPTSETVLKEIPSTGPASSDSPADKPDKEGDLPFSTKIGKPDSTGKPSGSFAALQYDGAYWTTKAPPAAGKSVKWDAFPSGTEDGTGPDAPGQYKVDKTLQRTPGAYGSPSPKESANEDLHSGGSSSAQMPDGSFDTVNLDDLRSNIDKVKNADQNNPRKGTHPWYADVKRHLINRAAALGGTNMIPPDWNLSMGMLAELEMARDIDTATRKAYLKKGWALSNLSYPIGNAGDLRSAIDLARSNHGDVTAAKALIRKRAKDLGVNLPPDMK